MSQKTLKIIFWTNLEDRTLPLEFVSHCWSLMNKALNHEEITALLTLSIGTVEQPQTLGEEEFDPRIEYTVPINVGRESRSVSNEHLVELIHFLQTYFKKEMESADFKFTVSVIAHSRDFFDAPFQPAQLDIAVERFAFVNIIYRHVPVIHRSVFVSNNTQNMETMRRYFNAPVHHPVMADFEYDRRQFIVRFPMTEMRYNHNTEREEELDLIVCLIIRVKTIKRIIAEMRHATKGYDLDLYFSLSCPVVIRRVRVHRPDPSKPPQQQNLLKFLGDRHSSWDKKSRILAQEINESPIFKLSITGLSLKSYCTLLSRLAATTDRRIEFRTLSASEKMPFANYATSPLVDLSCQQQFHNFNDRERYMILYMIEALFSRGATVKDYLLSDERSRNEFIQLVAQSYYKHSKVVLEVMERLLVEIDERLDIQPPHRIFSRIYEQIFRSKEVMDQIHETHSKEGYVKVRKVVITPTRTLFVAPELLMGNRVLRMDPDKYPLDKFLRVIFRDDDGTAVHAVSVGDWLIDKFIGSRLRNGVVVANRQFNYFGSSNSQLRDTGCYFINASVEEIADFRRQLGSFKIQSAPKMMSRLGQCFTQARESSVVLDRNHYADSYDYKGGADSNGEPYTFSDGVGKISMRTAKNLATDLRLDNCIPSCFQFRFRGYKGILAVDPAMDRLREWGDKNGISDTSDIKKEDCWLNLDIQFRPSQKKFDAKRDNQKLEVVKHSSPVAISLNRPVINILDQVSMMQSKESHDRICGRIHYLMDLYLHSLTQSLVDETKARNKLSEFPKLILYDQLSDLNLTNEPFFRGLIRASVRASLKKLRMKLQIPIPSHLSRAMFGVVDESGQLQYGQVFVRYTKNSFLKLPGPTAERVVLKGPVMITKNPSIVAGDIRMFEAVDLPCLHHLCDVVVFPRWGPRPHPDEMAGSDLDGDEYSVMWDTELYLDRNEEAFDYTSKSKEQVTTDEAQLRQKMAEFFVDYVRQDSIGRIANAFLINSDIFGISSGVCAQIAAKHMEAVDFPKTGVPPESLTTKWEGDDPPERNERAPDFMEKNNEPAYISPRLNGQLFRRAKLIDDILSCATQDEENATATVDPLISVDGYEAYLELASEHYDAYAVNLQSIMDSYGIKTEGELFSGHYTSLRNRISDKDSDDMSFYNTQNAIEQRLFTVFAKFRKQFFETPIAGKINRYEDVTAADHRRSMRSGVKDVFRRVCTEPSEEYQKLACAYYKIAYVSHKYLSFPWLAWDVLNVVRRTNACKSELSDAKYSFDPLSEALTKHIGEYISRRKAGFKSFVDKLQDPSGEPQDQQHAWSTVGRYCARYIGLDQILFFCVKWAKTGNVFEGQFNELHICLLLLQYGLNHLPCESLESANYWLDALDLVADEDFAPINLEQQHGGAGKKFIRFLEFLASRQFNTLTKLDFNEPELHYDSVFDKGEWRLLHQFALECYHQIAFTFRFNSLPATSEQRKQFMECVTLDTPQEAEPFVIEIPRSHTNDVLEDSELKRRLCKASGCKHVVFRDLPPFTGSETIRLYVSASGSMNAVNKLRNLLSVRPDLSLSNNARLMCKLMAEGVYTKLVNTVSNVDLQMMETGG